MLKTSTVDSLFGKKENGRFLSFYIVSFYSNDVEFNLVFSLLFLNKFIPSLIFCCVVKWLGSITPILGSNIRSNYFITSSDSFCFYPFEIMKIL